MNIKKLSVASSLAIATCLSAPAMAQDESEAQEEAETRTNQTNVIVVTAQFREQNLQETPIAITAVNAEMLAARGQTDISQVAAQAPNVTLRPQPQNGGSGLIAFIRGVGQTDFNFALDPAVGVYVDDVYIPTLSSSLLELVDLDRVEILRGPQGTLAGKNSLGGAIKLFSARPRGDGSGSLRAEYGSYNNISVRGMFDIGLTENLAMRVSGMGRSRDGYVDIVDYSLTHPNSNVPSSNARGAQASYETLGGQNVVAGRVALEWEPNDRLNVYVAGDFNREDSDAIPAVLLAAGAISDTADSFDPFSSNPATDANGNAWLPGLNGQPVPVDCRFVPTGQYSCDTADLRGLGFDPGFVSYSTFADTKVPTQQAPYKPYFALPITEFEGWGVMSNITYDISDALQFVAIGSYRTYVSRWGQDQDATPVPIAQLDNQLNHEAWSGEVRLNFEFADELVQGTVGGFYLDQDGTYTARVDLNYAGIDFVHGPDTTPSTTKAVFGTVTLN
ncbi:MAG: TonB-dependent receptor plug domain-containing protein, partial [Alteraurantiacibacter sp.]